MTVHLVTFASKPQKHHWDNVVRDFEREASGMQVFAEQYGWQWHRFDQEWLLQQPFHAQHKDVFSLPNLGWLFKPYCVWRVLREIEEGDILIWADSSTRFRSEPKEIIEHAREHGVWVHRHARDFRERMFCKRDTFVILDCCSEEFLEHQQIRTDLLALKKDALAMRLSYSWLLHSCNKVAIGRDDNIDGAPNFDGFDTHRAHMADQAILSLLTCKFGIENQPDPIDVLYYKEIFTC